MKHSLMTVLRILLVPLVFLCMSTASYASYGTEHILKGYFSKYNENTITISYWMDSSIGTDNGYRESIQNAVSQWGNVTTTVNFTLHSNLQTSTNVQFFRDSSGPSGVSGLCSYYVRLSSGASQIIPINEVANGRNYDIAGIWLFSNNMSTWSQAQKDHTAGHELGHALGLDHFENSPSHSGNHWMKSGRISLSQPTSTDKDHLKVKYS